MPDENQNPTPPSQNAKTKRGHWSGLIWLALGAYLLKSFAFDFASEDAHRKANWDAFEGVITQSEVKHLGLESGYELHFTFEVDHPSGKRQYKSSISQSNGNNYKKPVEGQFAIGKTLPVYINPENPAQFHRPKRQLGLKLIGYLGGGFFCYLGLSVLFSKQKPSKP